MVTTYFEPINTSVSFIYRHIAHYRKLRVLLRLYILYLLTHSLEHQSVRLLHVYTPSCQRNLAMQVKPFTALHHHWQQGGLSKSHFKKNTCCPLWEKNDYSPVFGIDESNIVNQNGKLKAFL